MWAEQGKSSLGQLVVSPISPPVVPFYVVSVALVFVCFIFVVKG